ISVSLIILDVLLAMRIPFSVSFLIGYVGTLLVFVAWHALLTKGWKRSLIMFTLSFIVAFTAEALGVNFGLVFGHYYYTPMLGPSLFGVPFLAALAWEPIVYAAFCLSDILASRWETPTPLLLQKTSPFWVAAIGALATTAWDMMIDPIAVSQGWWVWTNGGAYVPYVANGVPITNFLGWLLVAFVINLIYRWIADGMVESPPSAALTFYGPLTLYVSLFLTAFGVTLTILHRPEVALIGLLAMGPFIAIIFTNLSLFVSRQSKLSTTATKP
ncbi:MAG TPA: carotenoid biosynthesis protein, partial [Anaerolineales bacterium]|nr:carotenoid biosynthesis protein [Anaerolineales bacterium]